MVPPLHYVLLCKINTYLHVKNDTFKRVDIDILFYVKFQNFWYMTYCVPNLIPIWERNMAITAKQVAIWQLQQNRWRNFPNTQFNPPLQLHTGEYMYSPVSNCKCGLNFVFGKFHPPFCLISLYNLLEFDLKTAERLYKFHQPNPTYSYN